MHLQSKFNGNIINPYLKIWMGSQERYKNDQNSQNQDSFLEFQAQSLKLSSKQADLDWFFSTYRSFLLYFQLPWISMLLPSFIFYSIFDQSYSSIYLSFWNEVQSFSLWLYFIRLKNFDFTFYFFLLLWKQGNCIYCSSVLWVTLSSASSLFYFQLFWSGDASQGFSFSSRHFFNFKISSWPLEAITSSGNRIFIIFFYMFSAFSFFIPFQLFSPWFQSVNMAFGLLNSDCCVLLCFFGIFRQSPVDPLAIISFRSLNDDPIAVLCEQLLAPLMGQDHIPCFFHPAKEILFLVMLLSMGRGPIFEGGLSGRVIEFELAVAADEGRKDRGHLIDMMKLILSKGQHQIILSLASQPRARPQINIQADIISSDSGPEGRVFVEGHRKRIALADHVLMLCLTGLKVVSLELLKLSLCLHALLFHFRIRFLLFFLLCCRQVRFWTQLCCRVRWVFHLGLLCLDFYLALGLLFAEVPVVDHIVIILWDELNQPIMLLQERQQLLRRAIVGQLVRNLLLCSQELLEYFLNSARLTLPMPLLWQDSWTQKSRMQVGLSSLILPIQGQEPNYEVSVEEVFLADLYETQSFVLLYLNVDAMVSPCEFYAARYYLFQALGLCRIGSQVVHNGLEHLQRLLLLMRFQKCDVIFARAAQETLTICLKKRLNFHRQFHTDISNYYNQSGLSQMKKETTQPSTLRIKVQLKNVIASKQAHFFVLVQLKEANLSSNKSIKFRTETSSLTNRPHYDKNIFTFAIGDNPYTLKLGLMRAKSQLDSDATSAMVFGVASLPLTKKGILEQAKHTYETALIFVDQGKEVGKFTVLLTLADKEYKLNEDGIIFDPLISRVLYNEQCTDQARLQSNIKILQQKLQKLYTQLVGSKKQQQFFEKLYYNLEEDEKQLRNEIDSLEKINSKIEHKLDSLENLENLKIEIDMLSQSEEGKKVLISRLEYFQDRIYREIEENEKLAIEYKKIRPEIEANLKKAEDHAAKLKGRQLQQFQLQNNGKILQSYDSLVYQFQVNEQTIKSLAKMSQRSELTAQQAKLLLSQVNYEIKLTELGADEGKNAKQKQLLKYIEKEIHQAEGKEEKLSEEEEMVYKIKLAALQREIEEVRRKINKFQ